MKERLYLGDSDQDWSPDEINEIYRQAEEESRNEFKRSSGDPFAGITLTTFESRSSGKGRGRRPKEITLLCIDGRCWSIKDVPVRGLDVVLNERFPNLEPGVDELAYVLDEMERRNRRRWRTI